MKTCTWGFMIGTDEPCGEVCEGRTEFCATHNRQLRKESENEKKSISNRAQKIEKARIKNTIIIKSDITNPVYKLAKAKKAIRKVSKKREELNKEYFKLVEQFKKDNPKCKINANEYCTEKTEDPHHSRGRGSYLMDTSTWIPTCRSCHIYCEAHPNEAKEKGWSESRLQTGKPTI